MQQGDTYYSIARKYHITPEALQNINPSVKANAVRPGLVLRLKLPSEKTKSNAEESQKKTEAANKPETKQTVKREPKPLAKQEPKPAAKSESKTTGKSEQSKKDAISFRQTVLKTQFAGMILRLFWTVRIFRLF